MKKDLLNNLKAQLILYLKKNKIFSTERVYYPAIFNNIAYLYGALVIYDEDSMETTFIKIADFGYDN